MFRKQRCNKAVPQEIEMKELQPSLERTEINFSFSRVILDVAETKLIPRIALQLAPLCTIDECNRVPKKNYTNAEIKNEAQSVICHILDDTWIQIFSHLDIRSLVFIMLSCKKIASLANDDGTRERLYVSNRDHFFKMLSLKPTPLEFSSRTPALLRLQQQLPAQQQLSVHSTPQYAYYNDNPPGQGFVMR